MATTFSLEQVSLVELVQFRGTGLDERPGHGRPRQPDRPGTNRVRRGRVVAARNPSIAPASAAGRLRPRPRHATRRRTAAESRPPRHDESGGHELARAAPRGPPSPDCCRDTAPDRGVSVCGHTRLAPPTPSLRRRASLATCSQVQGNQRPDPLHLRVEFADPVVFAGRRTSTGPSLRLFLRFLTGRSSPLLELGSVSRGVMAVRSTSSNHSGLD